MVTLVQRVICVESGSEVSKRAKFRHEGVVNSAVGSSRQWLWWWCWGGGGEAVSDIWSVGSAGVRFIELKEIWKIFGVKTICDKRK